MANGSHSQACRDCKRIIREILVKEFYPQEVVEQHSLGLPSTIDGYKQHPYFSVLSQIETDLKKLWPDGFVSCKRLPPVDFFVRSKGLILEFDEAQHFTEPRRKTLERYPVTLDVGFDRNEWLRLCKRLNRHDKSPAYRDEQRAWFDTLRDFAPVYLGFLPIVRIYAGAAVWCDFDPSLGVKALLPYAPRLAQALWGGSTC